LVPHWDVLSIAWKCSKYRFWVCSNYFFWNPYLEHPRCDDFQIFFPNDVLSVCPSLYIYAVALSFHTIFCCKPPQFDWWKSGGGLYSHGVGFDQSLVLAQGIIGTALTPSPRKNARTLVTSRTFPSILQQFVLFIPRMSKSLYQAQLLSHMSTCEASYHVSWKDEHRSTCRLNLS
jgi:hypothetical protein